MTGFTVLIHQSPSGVHFDACLAETPGTELEKRLLTCVQTAVQACIRQAEVHWHDQIEITADEISQLAAAEFERVLRLHREEA